MVRISTKIKWTFRIATRTRLLALILLGSSNVTVFSQDLRDNAYLAANSKGVAHLFRVEHDEAISHYEALAREYPEHPGPHLARAMATWLKELYARQELELDQFISPGYFTRPSERPISEEMEKYIFDGFAEAQALAERHLELHPRSKDARYYLGAIEGARGAYAFTIDRSYMSALKHGKKAYQIQKAIIEEDPDYYDSYMTVGTYEYILGSLPWYIKWITTLVGLGGSQEQGFEHLVLAATKSSFVANESRVLLMVLYMREKQYEYSYQVAEQLHRLYPENFLFHLNKAQILEKSGDSKRAVEVYLEVVKAAEEKRKNYQKLPLGTFRYTAANRIFELGYPGPALELFEQAIRAPETPAREKVLSHLRAGEILDSMGNRERAIGHYEKVRELEDVEGSHRMAERYLDEPFKRK
jgi:tetratricopeptide (TPR) repeat protein